MIDTIQFEELCTIFFDEHLCNEFQHTHVYRLAFHNYTTKSTISSIYNDLKIAYQQVM